MTQRVNASQRVMLEKDGDKFARWCPRWKMKVVASTDHRSVLQVLRCQGASAESWEKVRDKATGVEDVYSGP